MILVTVSADEHPLGHERRFWCSIKEGVCKTGWFWSLACISTVVDNALEAILRALRFSPVHYSVRSMGLTWTFWVWLSFLYAAQVFGNDKDLHVVMCMFSPLLMVFIFVWNVWKNVKLKKTWSCQVSQAAMWIKMACAASWVCVHNSDPGAPPY